MALEIDDINLGGTLSATTISATTIVFGGQPIQNVFVQNNVTGGFLPISGGTVTGETLFNGGFSANTLNSGSTDLYNIFAKIGEGGTSTYVQPGSNIATGGTVTSPTISVVASPSFDALILSGAGQFAGVTTTSLSAATLSGGTILSGGTNLYSIFQTIGSTDQDPYLNLSGGTVTGNTVFTQGLTASTLSANTLNLSGQLTGINGIFTSLTGTSIFSGNTNLQNYFNTINAQLATKANDSGDTFTGQVNASLLSATTFSASNVTILSSFSFPVSPAAGYMLTSDANGNASWSPFSTGSGSTKLDLKTIASGSSAFTLTTTSTSFVDITGMSANTNNLGTSATTYQINFNAEVYNATSGARVIVRLLSGNTEISGTTRTVRMQTNAGTINGVIATSGFVTNVPFGTNLKAQWRVDSGTATMSGRTFSILGIQTGNLA